MILVALVAVFAATFAAGVLVGILYAQARYAPPALSPHDLGTDVDLWTQVDYVAAFWADDDEDPEEYRRVLEDLAAWVEVHRPVPTLALVPPPGPRPYDWDGGR